MQFAINDINLNRFENPHYFDTAQKYHPIQNKDNSTSEKTDDPVTNSI